MPNNHFVLVHGSWLGGWCWKPLQHVLAQSGIASSAPELSGLREIGTLARDTGSLSIHVADVAAHLRTLDGAPVVLVGHSYGAAVANEVAAHFPERISALINLDGFLTRGGRSLYDVCPALESVAANLIDPSTPDYILPAPHDLLGLSEEEARSLIQGRLRAMPGAANSEPARFDCADLTCRRIYIRFAQFPVFAETVEIAQREGWEASTIDVAHMAIMTQPEIVVSAMMRALAQPGADTAA